MKRLTGFGGGLGFFLIVKSGELLPDFPGLFSASETSLNSSFEKPCLRTATGVSGGLGGKGGGVKASVGEAESWGVL